MTADDSTFLIYGTDLALLKDCVNEVMGRAGLVLTPLTPFWWTQSVTFSLRPVPEGYMRSKHMKFLDILLDHSLLLDSRSDLLIRLASYLPYGMSLPVTIPYSSTSLAMVLCSGVALVSSDQSCSSRKKWDYCLRLTSERTVGPRMWLLKLYPYPICIHYI